MQSSCVGRALLGWCFVLVRYFPKIKTTFTVFWRFLMVFGSWYSNRSCGISVGLDCKVNTFTLHYACMWSQWWKDCASLFGWRIRTSELSEEEEYSKPSKITFRCSRFQYFGSYSNIELSRSLFSRSAKRNVSYTYVTVNNINVHNNVSIFMYITTVIIASGSDWQEKAHCELRGRRAHTTIS